MCWGVSLVIFFFFNDTATTEIYTLSLHDALPILLRVPPLERRLRFPLVQVDVHQRHERVVRSEEHTSELQSRENLVCRLLLEKKKKKRSTPLCMNKNNNKKQRA